jgi:hypothetical protein
VVAAIQIYRAYGYEAPDWKARRLIQSLPLKPRLMMTVSSALALLLLASIPKMVALALDRSLQTVTAIPTDIHRVQRTKLILDRARDARLKLSPATLQLVGKRMINAAADGVPGAWGAAVDAVSYRSLNQGPSPPLGKFNELRPRHYELAAVGGSLHRKSRGTAACRLVRQRNCTNWAVKTKTERSSTAKPI